MISFPIRTSGAMNTPHPELCAEDECDELEAFLIERIYEFNAQATGYFDATLLGGRRHKTSARRDARVSIS